MPGSNVIYHNLTELIEDLTIQIYRIPRLERQAFNEEREQLIALSKRTAYYL